MACSHRPLQAEHQAHVLATRDSADDAKLVHNQLWLQQQDAKEKARTDQMNALLDRQMDRLEEHNARIAHNLERAKRELRAEEYRATQTEAAAQASIKKYYMEKEAYQVDAMIDLHDNLHRKYGS